MKLWNLYFIYLNSLSKQTVPAPWSLRLKSNCFDLILLDAALIWSLMGCKFRSVFRSVSIMRIVVSSYFIAAIPVYKSNNGWRTRWNDHKTLLNVLNDYSPLSANKLTWGKQSIGRPWPSVESCAPKKYFFKLYYSYIEPVKYDYLYSSLF